MNRKALKVSGYTTPVMQVGSRIENAHGARFTITNFYIHEGKCWMSLSRSGRGQACAVQANSKNWTLIKE